MKTRLKRIGREQRKFLTSLKQHCKAGRTIVYLDEAKYSRRRNSVQRGISSEDTSQTPAKDPETMLLHAGNTDGFLPGCFLMTSPDKQALAADLPRIFDSLLFELWLVEKLLPAMATVYPGKSCVVVMDHAPAHSRRGNSAFNVSFSKEELVAILKRKNLRVPQPIPNKVALLQLMLKLKGKDDQIVVDKLITAAGHKILRVPRNYEHLNPMRKLWFKLIQRVRLGRFYSMVSHDYFSTLDLVREVCLERHQDLWKQCIKSILGTIARRSCRKKRVKKEQ